VFGARDRCDEAVDHIRSVRTGRFKYIRNFLPERPHLQPNRYKDGKPIVQRLRELHEAERLDALTETLLFSPTRAPEELYDLTADPAEISNLAGDPAHASMLAELRARLDNWMEGTGDRGREPEAASMYDSDMAVYLGEQSADSSAKGRILQQNIELMKR